MCVTDSYLIFHYADSSAVRGATTPKRHSLTEPLTASGGHGSGSPSHSRSDSSEGHSSSRRSSRDSGRMVVSPSHLHAHHHHRRSAHQTSSASVSSGERSSTSPIPVHLSSAYEQMLLNGSSSNRRSPNQQQKPRNVVGRSVSSPDHELSSGATRRIAAVTNQPLPAALQQGYHSRMMSSPETTSNSPSKYVRKPHKYDIVKFPHSYDEVEFMEQGVRPVLSQASTKSESKLNSTKWSHFAKRGSSEKRPNQPPNMHLSDTRLNKVSRRRASDKAMSARKSPGSSKRFSTGAVMMSEGEGGGGEARRRRHENSQAFVKAKYRVSNPEPLGSELVGGQRFSSIDEFVANGPGREVLAEEDIFLTSGDFEQVRRRLLPLELMHVMYTFPG